MHPGMKSMSPAYANKLIRQKMEEVRELISIEHQTATTTACLDEDTDELRNVYDFKATQKKIDTLNGDIIKIKHAINLFNTSYVLPNLGFTIDVALVMMKMLSEKKTRMAKMKAVREVSRTGGSFGNSQPEYTYRNYSEEDAVAEYNKTTEALTKIQLALDEANLLAIIEVDLD